MAYADRAFDRLPGSHPSSAAVAAVAGLLARFRFGHRPHPGERRNQISLHELDPHLIRDVGQSAELRDARRRIERTRDLHFPYY